MWLTALALLGLLLPVAQSQEAGRAPLQLRVERSAQGVFLSAVVPVQLPLSVENALLNGIAMHFVAQAQILRHRWYWSDKVLVNAMRYVRLSYQPLTRRWRVAQASEPIAPTGMGIALAQNYDTLQEALAAMGRISRWRVAQASELDEDTPYTLRLNYRLDTSQLPRPLQWGAVGGVNWNLQLEGAAAVPETAQPLPEVPPQEP
ncbi:MAG: DUF4390 domain-containing protein [Comamonas sp.]